MDAPGEAKVIVRQFGLEDVWVDKRKWTLGESDENQIDDQLPVVPLHPARIIPEFGDGKEPKSKTKIGEGRCGEEPPTVTAKCVLPFA
ncbi:MAG: hypothetical protein M3R15_05190, partial [Acidobacteriota bacterium]|nr:hypothetical protein [Acidobacteriota bacterium]